MIYSCILPWPPTVNTYWRSVNGRNILSKKARQYKKDVAVCLNKMDMQGDLSVTIECFMPDKRRRDLDNLLKPLLDVMGEYKVYEDDSQICDLRIFKGTDGDKGTVRIKVKELSNV